MCEPVTYITARYYLEGFQITTFFASKAGVAFLELLL